MQKRMFQDFSGLSDRDQQAVLKDERIPADHRQMLSEFSQLNTTEKAKVTAWGDPNAPSSYAERLAEEEMKMREQDITGMFAQTFASNPFKATELEQEALSRQEPEGQSFFDALYETATLGGVAPGVDAEMEEILAFRARKSRANNRFMRYVVPAATIGTANAAGTAWQLGKAGKIGLEALVAGGTEAGLQQVGVNPESQGNIAVAAAAPSILRGIFGAGNRLIKSIGRWTGARPFLHEVFHKMGGERLKSFVKGAEDDLWTETRRHNPEIDIGVVQDEFAKVANDLGRFSGANLPLKRAKAVMDTLRKDLPVYTSKAKLRQVEAAVEEARGFVDDFARKGGRGYSDLIKIKKSIERAISEAADLGDSEGARLLRAARDASKFNAGIKQIEKFWKKSASPEVAGGKKVNLRRFLDLLYRNEDELSAKLGPQTFDQLKHWFSEIGNKVPEVIPRIKLWDYLKAHPIFAGMIAGGGMVGSGTLTGAAAALPAILTARAIGRHGGKLLGPRIARAALEGKAMPEWMAYVAHGVRLLKQDELDRPDDRPKTKSEIERFFFGGG